MKKIIFIRHGKTEGNIAGRYIGRTDEPLAKAGIDELSGRKYPDADTLVSSPMKRCVQTAGIIYPEMEIITYNDLRECDFGDFENKTNDQLKTDPTYIKWIENAGRIPFPGGENAVDFAERASAAFERALAENRAHTLAFTVHGGIIMALMEKYCEEKRTFYEWHVKNGGGYICEWDEETKCLCKLEDLLF